MKYSRNEAIDFTKGSLIILMILNHCLFTFPVMLPHLQFLYSYITFITGAFVFISGFLISNIYLIKYNVHETKIYYRLLVRGLKLIAIFAVLNIVLTVVLKKSYNGMSLDFGSLIENSYSIFIPGNIEIIAYEILLPIAYVLIIASMLLLVLRDKFRFIKYISIGLFVYFSFKYTSEYFNLIHVMIGFCGIALGFTPVDRINKWFLKNIYVLSFAYLIYLIIIFASIFNHFVNLAGVFFNLMSIYIVGLKLTSRNIIADKLILIGKYSLISYIIHVPVIGVLNVLIVQSMQVNNLFLYVLPSFIITTAIVLAFIKFIAHYREKQHLVDKLYRLIFA